MADNKIFKAGTAASLAEKAKLLQERAVKAKAAEERAAVEGVPSLLVVVYKATLDEEGNVTNDGEPLYASTMAPKISSKGSIGAFASGRLKDGKGHPYTFQAQAWKVKSSPQEDEG